MTSSSRDTKLLQKADFTSFVSNTKEKSTKFRFLVYPGLSAKCVFMSNADTNTILSAPLHHKDVSSPPPFQNHRGIRGGSEWPRTRLGL